MTRLTLKWFLVRVFVPISIFAGAAEVPLVERALKGDATAQTNLGVMYAYGDGVQKDSVEAVKWFRKAAEQGYADAQNFLGLMYLAGTGVPKDATEAAKWISKAAEQGFAAAEYNIGCIHAQGIGVTKDINEANG